MDFLDLSLTWRVTISYDDPPANKFQHNNSLHNLKKHIWYGSTSKFARWKLRGRIYYAHLNANSSSSGRPCHDIGMLFFQDTTSFFGIPNLPKVLVSAKAKLGQELQCHMVLDQNPMESFVVHPKIRYFIRFWSVPLLYPSRTKRLNQHTGQASNLGVVALTKFDAARAKQEEKVEPVVIARWGIWWAEKNVPKRLKHGMW